MESFDLGELLFCRNDVLLIKLIALPSIDEL